MNDPSPKAGGQVGKIGKTEHFMVLRGLFPTLPTENKAEPNFVVLWAFLGTMRL